MNRKTLLHYTHGICMAVVLFTFTSSSAMAARAPFHVEEAGIDDLYQAIKEGRTTWKQIVQSYVDRARPYNGACTKLVTKFIGWDAILRYPHESQ